MLNFWKWNKGKTIEEIQLENEITRKFRKFLKLVREECEELGVESLTEEQSDKLFHCVFLNKTQVDYYNEYLKKHNMRLIRYPKKED